MRLLALLGVSVLVLSGCAAVVGESAHLTKNKVTINNNIDKAERGDQVAQFKVGNAYCCSVDEKDRTFYSTRKAVGWLCASAAQGYAPAMYKIGKIYSGDVTDGIRLARRLAQGIAGNSENHPVAYAWLVQAAVRGEEEEDAKARASKLWAKMPPTEQAETRMLVNAGLQATCRWEDAILSKR